MNHWLGVEIRHLAALEAVDAERSFRGAADRLGYVQSAVSQQISTLERLVGTRLVERSRGHSGVELTKSGALLVEHADRIITQLNAARADLDSLAAGAGGVLRVGAFQSVAARVMPQVLARVSERHPGLEIRATESMSDASLFEQVEAGDLDVAFAELPLVPGPFESMDLVVDPCVLVVHTNSPLAQLDRVPSLEEIASLPLAFPTWRMAELIEQQLGAVGHAPQCSRLETNTAVQALVGAGMAATIMPLLAVNPNLPGTKIIDLEGLLPERKIVLFWHRERIHAPELTAFAETVKNVCREIGGSQPDYRKPSGKGRVVVLRLPSNTNADDLSAPDEFAAAAGA